MTQTAETETTRVAGRELDALVAERVMGLSLDIPLARRLAMVGVNFVWSTGLVCCCEVFGEERRIGIPDDLAGDPSDDNHNQRYYRYVAQTLIDEEGETGAKVQALVDGLRETPLPYSTDFAAARKMEDEMERRGLHESYAAALYGITVGTAMIPTNRDVWALVHATPLQRCLAALRALASSDSPESAETKDGAA